jgi:hypothetical protein
MLIAAGAIDRRLEPEGRYLAKRREGQQVKHAPNAKPSMSSESASSVPAMTLGHRYPSLLALAFSVCQVFAK